MKKTIILLLCILLCSCSKGNDINNKLDKIFEQESTTRVRVNNYTNYIEYYLPSDINEEECEPLSYVFSLDDCRLIMNVNISNILKYDYYKDTSLNDEGFFDTNNLIYDRSGQFIDNDGNDTNYFFKAYQYNESALLYFVSDYVYFYGYCPIDKIELLTSKTLQVAKAANVRLDRVINDFSTNDVIDYQRGTIDLFEKTLPKEGPIEEFMITKDNQVSE